MPSNRPHLNIRLTEEWAEELPRLLEKGRRVLKLPVLSQTDAVLIALRLLDEWLDKLEANEQAGRTDVDMPLPESLGTQKRGRPRKATAEDEEAEESSS